MRQREAQKVVATKEQELKDLQTKMAAIQEELSVTKGAAYVNARRQSSSSELNVSAGQSYGPAAHASECAPEARVGQGQGAGNQSTWLSGAGQRKSARQSKRSRRSGATTSAEDRAGGTDGR